MNRHFSSEDIQMADKHVQRCSTSIIGRGMQIETTIRYHLTSTRVAIIMTPENMERDECRQGCGEVRIPVSCWWEYKNGPAAVEGVWPPLTELNVELPPDLATPLQVCTPKNRKQGLGRRIVHLCALKHHSRRPKGGNNPSVRQHTSG